MSFSNYFAKCFGISKARKAQHIEGREADKAVRRMMKLSEQRALHGHHQRASSSPMSPLILSNPTHISSTISNAKNGSTFDGTATENNLVTFCVFQKTLPRTWQPPTQCHHSLRQQSNESSPIPNDFATKKGQKTFSPDVSKVGLYQDSSLFSLSTTDASSNDFLGSSRAKTKPKDTCSSESLILPIPNRDSREQLRFWQAKLASALGYRGL